MQNENTPPEETNTANQKTEAALDGATSAWENTPNGWGYYWVDKGDGDIRMMCLQPGKTWRHEGLSVEAWKCPGESRYRLIARKMPKWKWLRITLPNVKHIHH